MNFLNYFRIAGLYFRLKIVQKISFHLSPLIIIVIHKLSSDFLQFQPFVIFFRFIYWFDIFFFFYTHLRFLFLRSQDYYPEVLYFNIIIEIINYFNYLFTFEILWHWSFLYYSLIIIFLLLLFFFPLHFLEF